MSDRAPVDWSPEVEETRRRRAMAVRMGGEESVARQHAAGKLTVRERIAGLLDHGSFREIGALAGKAKTQDGAIVDFQPANFVGGTGTIDGRRVVVGGEDFTVRGGSSDGGGEAKWELTEQMALEWHLPVVRLIDGTGGSVKTVEDTGRSYLPVTPGFGGMVRLMGEVPVVSAVVGPAAGWAAAKAVAAHWTVMVRDTSQIFVAGPPVVRRALGEVITKEALGGDRVHASSGVADNVAADEADCFRLIRRFLSYLPANVWELPPRQEPADDPQRREQSLLSIIPRNRRRPYDVRRLLGLILDLGSFFELTPSYGRSLVTGLARIDGYAVGVTANDPLAIGGAMDRAASEKLMRFVDLCDTFHLPVVHFVDQPGFMIGAAAERQGTIRMAVRALFAAQESSMPWVSVVVRRCFGVAGGAHYRERRLNLRYAWPSAEWGSLPAEGGVEAAYRRRIAAAPDPDAERARLEQEILRLSSPFLTAESFGVEEIIDPRDTRPLLCEFAQVAYGSMTHELGPKVRRGMRP